MMAAVVSGPGKGAAGFCEIELLRNRFDRAAEVTDPRRCERAMSLVDVVLPEAPLLVLSEDMMGRKERRSRREESSAL